MLAFGLAGAAPRDEYCSRTDVRTVEITTRGPATRDAASNVSAVSAVVCMPGASDSKRSFRDLTPRWPAGVRSVFHNVAGLIGELELSSSYRWQNEIDLLAADLQRVRDERIYLLGISGGASLALAYVAAHPEEIAGLGLIEPAWSFLPLTAIERQYFAHLDDVLQLPPNKQRDAFVRLLVQPGVELPPVTPIAQRGYQGIQRSEDTGLSIVTRAVQGHHVDPADLKAFKGSVYVAVGGRSNPMWQTQAAQIKAALPQTIVDIYADRHHLDLPHHAEADRLSRALITAWNLP
jgi:pimeloyl-ACP methyl ester carboxylesterase